MLTLVTAGSLLASAMTRLQTLAWLTAIGGMLTGLTLMVRLGVVAPYAIYFIALGVAALWLGYMREWKGPALAHRVAGGRRRVRCDHAGARPDAARPADRRVADPGRPRHRLLRIDCRAHARARAARSSSSRSRRPCSCCSSAWAVRWPSAGPRDRAGRPRHQPRRPRRGGLPRLRSPSCPRDSAGALNFYFYSSLALIFVLSGLAVAVTGVPQALALTALGGSACRRLVALGASSASAATPPSPWSSRRSRAG